MPKIRERVNAQETNLTDKHYREISDSEPS